MGEVLAFVEEGFSGHFGEGVGETVAEVECGGVVAAEFSPGVSGNGDLFRRYRDDLDGHFLDERIKSIGTQGACTTLHHDSGLKKVERGHTKNVCIGKDILKARAFRLFKQNGANCRGIDDHLGSPYSP